jgi:hypothetical protein
LQHARLVGVQVAARADLDGLDRVNRRRARCRGRSRPCA